MPNENKDKEVIRVEGVPPGIPLEGELVTTLTDHGRAGLLRFRLTEPIGPLHLPHILKIWDVVIEEFKKRDDAGILLVSGRGPTWLYAALTHRFAHLFKVLAVFDPKLSGYVVVATHSPDVELGILLEEESER